MLQHPNLLLISPETSYTLTVAVNLCVPYLRVHTRTCFISFVLWPPRSVFRTSLVTSDWCQSGCYGGSSKTWQFLPWRQVSWSRCWRACWTTPRTRTPASELRASTPSSTCYSCAGEMKPCRSACRLPAVIYHIEHIHTFDFFTLFSFCNSEYHCHSGLCK